MEPYTETQNAEASEKAFFHNLITTVVSILICLVMLCSTTFAWFSSGTSSDSNALSSGSFSLTVLLGENIGDAITEENEMEPFERNESNGVCTYKLSAGEYLVLLVLSEETKAKGHCAVEINGVERHTEVIIGENTVNKDGYEMNAPLSFVLEIVEDDTLVKFVPQWGIAIDATLHHEGRYSSSEWIASSESGK